MYFSIILVAALIFVLIFIAYNRPWVTAAGAFRLARLFAAVTLLQIGISMISTQQYALRIAQNYGQTISELQWPEQPKTLLTISLAATILSWIFLLLTLRGVFKVLSLWNPDQRNRAAQP